VCPFLAHSKEANVQSSHSLPELGTRQTCELCHVLAPWHMAKGTSRVGGVRDTFFRRGPWKTHDKRFAMCPDKNTRQTPFAGRSMPCGVLLCVAHGKPFAVCYSPFVFCPWHMANKPNPVVHVCCNYEDTTPQRAQAMLGGLA